MLNHSYVRFYFVFLIYYNRYIWIKSYLLVPIICKNIKISLYFTGIRA